jgi:hypothetical protein
MAPREYGLYGESVRLGVGSHRIEEVKFPAMSMKRNLGPTFRKVEIPDLAQAFVQIRTS